MEFKATYKGKLQGHNMALLYLASEILYPPFFPTICSGTEMESVRYTVFKIFCSLLCPYRDGFPVGSSGTLSKVYVVTPLLKNNKVRVAAFLMFCCLL